MNIRSRFLVMTFCTAIVVTWAPTTTAQTTSHDTPHAAPSRS